MAGRRHSISSAPEKVALALMISMGLTSVVKAELTARDIMKNADEKNRPQYEIDRAKMELLGVESNPLVRTLIGYYVNDADTRMSLTKFTQPESMRNVGTLVIETKGKPNSIWHYLPATRNVRRIAGEQRQNRFMGTELIFEDFEGLKLSKYAFTLLRSETCGEGRHCYVVAGHPSEPKERKTSSYSKKVYWVDSETFVILKMELYDRTGRLEKVAENSDIRQVGKYWRPYREAMRNLLNGRSTVLTEMDRKIDEPFDRYYVGQQYLRSE